MAIFFPGMKCPLCGERIERDQGRRLFPPFVRNSLDSLYVFHDATVHEECLANDLRIKRLEDILSKRSASRRGSQTCLVCHGSIANSQDLYSTDYITSDAKDQLFIYNFLNFHRDHLKQWESWSEFRRLATERQVSDVWCGPAILPPAGAATGMPAANS